MDHYVSTPTDELWTLEHGNCWDENANLNVGMNSKSTHDLIENETLGMGWFDVFGHRHDMETSTNNQHRINYDLGDNGINQNDHVLTTGVCWDIFNLDISQKSGPRVHCLSRRLHWPRDFMWLQNTNNMAAFNQGRNLRTEPVNRAHFIKITRNTTVNSCH